MISPRALRNFLLSGTVLGLCAAVAREATEPLSNPSTPHRDHPMQTEYLEIVTPDVDATCEALAAVHGVTFSEPNEALGQARTADLADGGRIGIRAPMHGAETPVVRPYILVQDIDVAVAAAEEAGGEIAMAPTPMPDGTGRFAIYFLGGIQYGLWQK